MSNEQQNTGPVKIHDDDTSLVVIAKTNTEGFSKVTEEMTQAIFSNCTTKIFLKADSMPVA